MFNNKKILITGGTGSFGQFFVSKILKKYKKIKRLVIFSRDELKQYEMQKNYDEKKYPFLKFFIGDVRDVDRLKTAFKDIDYVFHTAALKQVPAAEYNPFEFVKTNILGTQNVVDASLANDVKKVIFLSTDKACSPLNLYGATKLAAEKIIIAANNIKGKKKISFSVVRYGNVMGSRGSVIPAFINAKKENKPFLITDYTMTRFNLTLDQATNYVINFLKIAKGNEIFIPKLPTIFVKDIAKAIDSKNKTKKIGIRVGEKLFEELISQSEIANCEEKKNYFIIYPDKSFLKKKSKKIYKGYNSKDNRNILNVKDIKDLIKNSIN